jgi:hypothetical protein
MSDELIRASDTDLVARVMLPSHYEQGWIQAN